MQFSMRSMVRKELRRGNNSVGRHAFTANVKTSQMLLLNSRLGKLLFTEVRIIILKK